MKIVKIALKVLVVLLAVYGAFVLFIQVAERLQKDGTCKDNDVLKKLRGTVEKQIARFRA